MSDPADLPAGGSAPRTPPEVDVPAGGSAPGTPEIELAHGVLLRVADFLRKLPADQLAELADGTMKLEVVPKGGRRRAARATTPAPVSAPEVRAALTQIGDRTAGRRWLEDQRLTVPQLVTIAKELGIATAAKPRKDAALDQIVQWTIGRRLDSAAISGPGPRTPRRAGGPAG